MSPAARKLTGWILAAIFALALTMGAGPGIFLIDQTQSWFGLPRLYVWVIFWFCVEAIVVVVTYTVLWRAPDTEQGDR